MIFSVSYLKTNFSNTISLGHGRGYPNQIKLTQRPTPKNLSTNHQY